jgi:hypothetical protein
MCSAVPRPPIDEESYVSENNLELEARDPATTPARLLELTETHSELRRLIVRNPSCPDVARQWILAVDPGALDPEPEVADSATTPEGPGTSGDPQGADGPTAEQPPQPGAESEEGAEDGQPAEPGGDARATAPPEDAASDDDLEATRLMSPADGPAPLAGGAASPDPGTAAPEPEAASWTQESASDQEPPTAPSAPDTSAAVPAEQSPVQGEQSPDPTSSAPRPDTAGQAEQAPTSAAPTEGETWSPADAPTDRHAPAPQAAPPRSDGPAEVRPGSGVVPLPPQNGQGGQNPQGDGGQVPSSGPIPPHHEQAADPQGAGSAQYPQYGYQQPGSALPPTDPQQGSAPQQGSTAPQRSGNAPQYGAAPPYGTTPQYGTAPQQPGQPLRYGAAAPAASAAAGVPRPGSVPPSAGTGQPGQVPPASAESSPLDALEAGGGQEPPDEDKRDNRRSAFACVGCLVLLAALLVVVGLVGRSFLHSTDDSAPEASSTPSSSASEKTPEQKETPKKEKKKDKPSKKPEKDKKPAPKDATKMGAVISPTGNIICTLEGDTVGCTVNDHIFPDSLESCDGDSFAIVADKKGSGPACGEKYDSGAHETLAYDKSAKNDNLACTSKSDGMTCWNVKSGKGFFVNKQTYSTF